MVARCTSNVVTVHISSDVEPCDRRNMTKINLFANHFFLLIIIIFGAIAPCLSAISDKRLCSDPNCSEPISLARTLTTYIAREPLILSFGTDVNVIVYSKGAGNRTDLWGVEINGKRGYVPQALLKEYKILSKNLTFVVPTSKDINKINEKDDRRIEREKKLEDVSKRGQVSHGTIVISAIIPAKEEVLMLTTTTQNLPPVFNATDGTTLPLDDIKPRVDSSATIKNVEATNLSVLSSDDTVTIASDNTLHENGRANKESEDTVKSTEEEEKYLLPSIDVETDIKGIAVDKFVEGSGTNLGDIAASLPTNYFKIVEDNTTIITKLGQDVDVLTNDTNDAVETKSARTGDNDGLQKILLQSQRLHLLSDNTDNVQSSSVVSNVDDVEKTSVIVPGDTSKPMGSEVKRESLAEAISHSCRQSDIFSIQIPLPGCSVTKEATDQVTNNDIAIESSTEHKIVTVNKNDTIDHRSHRIITEHDDAMKYESHIIPENVGIDNKDNIPVSILPTENMEESVHSDINSNDSPMSHTSSLNVPRVTNDESYSKQQQQQQLSLPLPPPPPPLLHSNHENAMLELELKQTLHMTDFPKNQNLLSTEESVPQDSDLSTERVEKSNKCLTIESLPEYEDVYSSEYDADMEAIHMNGTSVDTPSHHGQTQAIVSTDSVENGDDNSGIIASNVDHNYWETMIYVVITACTTLIFSLGYYYIENVRRDSQLIRKVNRLEKELLVSTKECTMLYENLKSANTKLTRIEDESFGSNEMVLSLKADLEASQNAKAELEYQVASLDKDLESATEAGLELERMLREFLSSNNAVNPLAQSVEDLQARLNTQQIANESLTNALNLKAQENEALVVDLDAAKKRYEEIEVELTRVTEDLKLRIIDSNIMEKNLNEKVRRLEVQIKEISNEKSVLSRELKTKEAEIKDIAEVMNQLSTSTLDLEKLYDVSSVRAEAAQLLEERDELKVRLTEVEGAHNLLDEHVKLVKEEMSALSEQCKVAEKNKKDAETRLEVLSNFFKEKEAKRQKEEAAWLQKQGEVTSTVERIQTMQNEMQSYKQQIEMLRREIVDQEREYKSQIAALETKAHEQWVAARQNERRLEESKAEAGQLRNRLTLMEKNISADTDPDGKLHRLDANGETTTSPSLFMGADSSSSPIMFTGSSGVPPPPPPSYMHCSLFPPYLPPPLPVSLTGGGPGSSGMLPPPASSYDPVGQRPPPLGGRLSSPPPLPLHPPPLGGRYDSAGSPPPPISPHLLPPYDHHRSPAPPPPPPPIPSHFIPNDHHLHHHHHHHHHVPLHHHSHPPPSLPASSSMLPSATAVAATATATATETETETETETKTAAAAAATSVIATTTADHQLVATHSWTEETTLPSLRTSSFHPHQREQRVRNHKGSLHSSGESLDKTHHSGKV